MKRKILIAGLLLFLSFGLPAQPPPPQEEPSCWPTPCVPIDGGALFLIAAGALLGVKKTMDRATRRKKC